jgi:3-hydroxyacyl-CoA dehydrogenase
MPLLEIVRGRRRAEKSSRRPAEAGQGASNKSGVVVGNCFGFVANRMLATTCARRTLLLEEGASVAADRPRADDFGLPVGPYGMQDIAGIDVGRAHPQYFDRLASRARRVRSRRFPIGCSRWAVTARKLAPAGTSTTAPAAGTAPRIR